jgi:hypothetical protein
MTIYMDRFGHLVTDNEDLAELHSFAKRLGLRREWFQDDHPEHPHYDLTTPRARDRAQTQGARLVSPAEVILILKKTQERRIQNKWNQLDLPIEVAQALLEVHNWIQLENDSYLCTGCKWINERPEPGLCRQSKKPKTQETRTYDGKRRNTKRR